MPLALSRLGDLLGQEPELPLERMQRGEIAIERGLGRHGLGVTFGRHHARVHAARKAGEPQALGAVASHQVGLVRPLQVRDGGEAVAPQARLGGLADAR